MHLWRADKQGVFSRCGARCGARFHKGMTIIEVLVASALLILGISVVMELSNVVHKSRKNSYLALTADRLAQDLLGRAVIENCIWNQVLEVCHNLTARNMTSFSVWVNPVGEVEYIKPEKGDGSIEFEARFDVHTTSGCVSGISNINCELSVDSASAWGLDRVLFEEQKGNLHNVRITVSYLDPFHRGVRFASYQTRIAP